MHLIGAKWLLIFLILLALCVKLFSENALGDFFLTLLYSQFDCYFFVHGKFGSVKVFANMRFHGKHMSNLNALLYMIVSTLGGAIALSGLFATSQRLKAVNVDYNSFCLKKIGSI